jgi:outer membrane lipoprotein SlyB
MQNIIKNTVGLKAVVLVLAGLMLSGCYATTDQVKKQMITVGGCASGGLIGSNVGSGSGKTVAIITGTIAGCQLGKKAAEQVVDKNQ